MNLTTLIGPVSFLTDPSSLVRLGGPAAGHSLMTSSLAQWGALAGGLFVILLGGLLLFRWRRLLAQKLKREEEKFRNEMAFTEAIIDSLPDRCFVLDSTGRYTRWNKNAGKSLGYSSEEFAALDPLTNVAEEDRALAASKMEEAFTKGSASADLQLLTKDGRKVPHLLTVTRAVIGDKIYLVGTAVNVTARKQAEGALRASEIRYRRLFEVSQDGILILDADSGKICDVNPFLATLLGYSPDELKGKKLREVASFRDVPLSTVGLREMQSEGSIRYENLSLPSRDGKRIEVEFVSSCYYTDQQRVIQCNIRDITGRKRAQEKLQEYEKVVEKSEERYRTLFENSPVGIYRSTPQGSVLAGNPALVRMFGYSSFEELAARNLNLAGSGPEYPRSQFVERMEKDGEVIGLECVWYKRNGEALYARENARAIRDDAGKIICYEGTVEDITARKRAEEEVDRLVTAIEQSAEAVVITNTAGNIEYVNPAFTRITGYSREEALGSNPKILKSGRHDPEFYRQLWATILQGEIWHGEIVNKRKDGSHYTEEMNIAPVRGAHGEVTHFIATKQDVTERRALEIQLQQTAKMEAVGRLAGGVAHDFNNLLTVINGYSDLLQERLGSDHTAGAHLKEIKKAGEHAASLTRQLLAFSRRQVLTPQVIDLNIVVANLGKMLQRLIGEDIQLRTLLEPSLCRVKADPGQIEQVIMNLAVNARDAMPSGGNLTIETRNVELDETYARSHASVKPGPHVMLSVSDTGVGMSKETVTRIFEPFFTTKEQGKGTGLGLATVYGIVKQSEGSIWVYSELGHGTVFKVYLPSAEGGPLGKGPATLEADAMAGTETILMVEDESGVRALIRLALETSGYKVLEMNDGESALQTCATYAGPIHLLLTDVVMPRMSGPVVAKKVASLRPSIKVLYMSGYTDDAVLHHGVLSPNAPFLQKPFSPVALRKRIREILDGK